MTSSIFFLVLKPSQIENHKEVHIYHDNPIQHSDTIWLWAKFEWLVVDWGNHPKESPSKHQTIQQQRHHWYWILLWMDLQQPWRTRNGGATEHFESCKKPSKHRKRRWWKAEVMDWAAHPITKLQPHSSQKKNLRRVDTRKVWLRQDHLSRKKQSQKKTGTKHSWTENWKDSRRTMGADMQILVVKEENRASSFHCLIL